MGGCFSGEIGRTPRIESPSYSSLESYSRRYDAIRSFYSSQIDQSFSSSSSDRHISWEKADNLLDKLGLETFKSTFHTHIKEIADSVFVVRSKAKSGEGIYKNIISIDKGQFIGIKNYRNNTNNWFLSEIIYIQLQISLEKAGKDISQFDLKSWYGKHIEDEETKNTARSLLPEEEGRWAFSAGSDEFNALAQTPTAKSKFYLLKDYPEAFSGKQVTSITVIQHSDGKIDIEYEFS